MSDELSDEDMARIDKIIEIGRDQRRERKDSAAKGAADKEVGDAAR